VNGPDAVLEAYVRGKDAHRPDVAAPAFAPDARLTVRNATTAVDFPDVTTGRDAILDVLVVDFGRRYANVRSLCLDRPAPDATSFSCDWLVGMTARDDGGVRVGAGRYDWTLRARPPWCATALTIMIDAMQILPPSHAGPVLAWLRALDYPWTSADAAIAGAPSLDVLAPVLRRLARRRAAR
jgi:hypothetical protein